PPSAGTTSPAAATSSPCVARWPSSGARWQRFAPSSRRASTHNSRGSWLSIWRWSSPRPGSFSRPSGWADSSPRWAYSPPRSREVVPMNQVARFAALGLSAALAGSCGGSSAPSKASFITKADAICKAEEAAIAKLDHSDRARYLRAGTAILQREVADLRALKEPKEGRATRATWLGQLADTAT